jgi:diadenosine tetraphosphate (Ap4A) HIT family hydrolase
MATLFSRIIAGELPGRFVWSDPQVVAFLSIAPLRPGHTLVVPRAEIDQWTAADPALLAHATGVAQVIGQAQQKAWDAPRIALAIVGFEVPHMHIHVSPAWDMGDIDFTGLEPEPDASKLDEAADRLRAALREAGHTSTGHRSEE